jgi:hypothetical protein
MTPCPRRPSRIASDRAPHPSDQHAWHLGVHVAERSRLLVLGPKKRLLERVDREPVLEEWSQDHPERPMEVPLQDGLTRDGDPFAFRRLRVRGDLDRVDLRAAAFRIELNRGPCIA